MKDKKKRYNYFGEELALGSQRVSKEEYFSNKDGDGNEWALYEARFLGKDHVRDGFSKKEKIEDYIIPQGAIIVRFGFEKGRYSAPDGTTFEQVALPYKIESLEFHRYRVLKDLPVECVKEFKHDIITVIENEEKREEEILLYKGENVNKYASVVEKGMVAEAFGQIGGGVQYRHYASIKRLVLTKVLEELFEEEQYGNRD